MASLTAERPGWRARMRSRRWTALALCVVGCVGYSFLSGWRDSHAFLINTSVSLPNWAFLIHRNKRPLRGEHVFFTPPASRLVTRHFGAPPLLFGKIVYGVAGDIVVRAGRDVFINGRRVGRMKPRTRLGEELRPGPTGRIPQGCLYAGTPHPDGFDSRYAEIGFVCAEQIIGTGEPIL